MLLLYFYYITVIIIFIKIYATPLHAAAITGNLSIVQWIMNKRKGVLNETEIKTIGGETPLMWAW